MNCHNYYDHLGTYSEYVSCLHYGIHLQQTYLSTVRHSWGGI